MAETIPPSAIARYWQLRDRAEAKRAAYIDYHNRIGEQRDEVRRLDDAVQLHGSGVRVHVDDDGSAYTFERRVGPYRAFDGGSTATQAQEITYPRKPVKETAELRRAVELLLTARKRVADLAAWQAEASAAGGAFGTLANACEGLLRRRGWTPTGAPEVLGANTYLGAGAS